MMWAYAFAAAELGLRHTTRELARLQTGDRADLSTVHYCDSSSDADAHALLHTSLRGRLGRARPQPRVSPGRRARRRFEWPARAVAGTPGAGTRRASRAHLVDQLEVVLYVKKRSLRCWRAKGFLACKGYYVKVTRTTNEELGELLTHFTQGLSHKRLLPYVFIGHRPVGGFADIKSLESSGTLERLVRGQV